jgi:hypothetical protein
MRSLDEPPPFWGSWERIYVLVAAALAAQTLIYWLLGIWAGA